MQEDKAVEKKEPPVEAKVGDLVEFFMGKGQVREIREEDGVCTLEVWAMGWEMAGEQRPRFFLQRDAVKVVPTVYYKMPGKRTRGSACAFVPSYHSYRFKITKPSFPPPPMSACFKGSSRPYSCYAQHDFQMCDLAAVVCISRGLLIASRRASCAPYTRVERPRCSSRVPRKKTIDFVPTHLIAVKENMLLTLLLSMSCFVL